MAVSFSRTDCMCLVTEAEFCHVDICLWVEAQKKKLSYISKS